MSNPLLSLWDKRPAHRSMGGLPSVTMSSGKRATAGKKPRPPFDQQSASANGIRNQDAATPLAVLAISTIYRQTAFRNEREKSRTC